MKRPKRAGMRSYRIGRWIITRDRPWRWLLGPDGRAGMPPDFFAMRFPTLTAAVQFVSRETHDVPK